MKYLQYLEYQSYEEEEERGKQMKIVYTCTVHAHFVVVTIWVHNYFNLHIINNPIAVSAVSWFWSWVIDDPLQVIWYLTLWVNLWRLTQS